MLDLVRGGTLFYGHQLISRRHNGRYGLRRIGLKPQVATRHNARKISVFHYRDTRNTMSTGEFDQFGNRGCVINSDRVFDNTTFKLLNAADLLGLLLDRQVFMNDTDATLLR